MTGLRPPANPGMAILDRSKFSVWLPLLMAKVNPVFIGQLAKTSPPGDLLDLRGVTRVVKKGSERAVLFDPAVTDKSQLSQATRDILDQADAEFETYRLELGYDHWTTEEVLHSVLPADLGDIPSGFTVVGHIAHINLRDQFLPYKELIGQVILDKNPAVRTVVNKLDSIHAVYRTFDMEVIAGAPDDFLVEQHESGCRFRFDFSKVYWNSRLHREHERLVSLFKSGEAVCDPFAGVGPFAVPAGKKGVLVFASDLNPDSYAAMENNVALNKVDDLVYVFNEDGREFIRRSPERLLKFQQHTPVITLPSKKTNRNRPAPPPVELEVPKFFSHYVMNLPDSAIEFLDAFSGLYRNVPGAQAFDLPTIHVHCFFKHAPTEPEPSAEKVYEALAERISLALDHPVPADKMRFHDVRKVAPTKEMYCVSFRLPKEVAFGES